MKTAQLIKRTVTALYKDSNGNIVTPLSDSEKLQLSIFGDVKTMIMEEVVQRWSYKTKKSLDDMFYSYMVENNIEDCSNYYIVC